MRTFLFVFLCNTIPLFLIGKIIETSQFDEILSHVVSDKVLVVFDIDNTLIKTKGHFGGVAWEDHVMNQLIDKGIPCENIVKLGARASKILQPYIQMELVDPKTAQIVKKIKEGNLVFALTARAPHEASCTHDQLLSNGLDLAHEEIPSQTIHRRDLKALYDRGVLFATILHKKSEVLFAFLDHHGIKPECIIFVDDKVSHLEDLMKACKERDIEYVGVRFSGADRHVNSFDPVLAQKEWENIDDDHVQALRLELQEMLERKKEL